MGTRLTDKELLSILKEFGYTAENPKQYQNLRTKLDLKCANGHLRKVTLRSLKMSPKCPQCHQKPSISKALPNANKEQICSYLKSIGFELLSNYKNATSYIEVKDVKTGEAYKTKWNWIQQGKDPRNKSNKKTVEEICNIAQQEGYKLLSPYNSAHQKLKWVCDKGHSFYSSWNSFRNGHRCKICRGFKPVRVDDIAREAKIRGYRLVSGYTPGEKILLEDHEDVVHSIDWFDFKSGHNPQGQPQWERELSGWLISQGFKVNLHDRSQIAPKEIDIWLPDFKIGIELHGSYWHSEKFVDKNYHLKKAQSCWEKGIWLIQLFDKQWEKDPDYWKRRIFSLIEEIKGENFSVSNNKVLLEDQLIAELEEDELKLWKRLNPDQLRALLRLVGRPVHLDLLHHKPILKGPYVFPNKLQLGSHTCYNCGYLVL